MNNITFENYIDAYLKDYKNCKTYWNYEDGCVLIGCREMYLVTGDEKYYNFIKKYVDAFVDENGNISPYEMQNYNIDCINSGKILFFLYDKTGEEKYRKAMDVMMEQLKGQPRCENGSFWHKKIYPNQLWLDGLYMAQPFYMEYETKYHKKEMYNDIIRQFENVQKYLYDEEKGLCYHGYEETKSIFWADKETGRSKSFWLRSIGWHIMAVIDTMDAMSFEIFEHYKRLQDIFKLLIKGILQYQDKETGLFYQVVDKAETEGNYLETSGSAMIGYAILKACRMGVLSKEKYMPIGIRIVESILHNKFIEGEDGFHLRDICGGAGLGPATDLRRDGSVTYYLNEKIVTDECKAVGVLMQAYAQYLQLQKDV